MPDTGEFAVKVEGLRMHFATLHLAHVATLGPAVGHAVHFI